MFICNLLAIGQKLQDYDSWKSVQLQHCVVKRVFVAPDKALFSTKKIFCFLFLHGDILWYSSEENHWNASNEYPQVIMEK